MRLKLAERERIRAGTPRGQGWEGGPCELSLCPWTPVVAAAECPRIAEEEKDVWGRRI